MAEREYSRYPVYSGDPTTFVSPRTISGNRFIAATERVPFQVSVDPIPWRSVQSPESAAVSSAIISPEVDTGAGGLA